VYFIGCSELEVFMGEDAEVEWKTFRSTDFPVEPVTIELGGAILEWTPVMDLTRKVLHQVGHKAISQLKIRTDLYELIIYSVQFRDETQRKHRLLHLLDYELVRLVDRTECMEGVWGRTSCLQARKLDVFLYDLNGDIFSTQFYSNLYVYTSTE
jgi:hypothetical protein